MDRGESAWGRKEGPWHSWDKEKPKGRGHMGLSRWKSDNDGPCGPFPIVEKEEFLK